MNIGRCNAAVSVVVLWVVVMGVGAPGGVAVQDAMKPAVSNATSIMRLCMGYVYLNP